MMRAIFMAALIVQGCAPSAGTLSPKAAYCGRAALATYEAVMAAGPPGPMLGAKASMAARDAARACMGE